MYKRIGLGVVCLALLLSGCGTVPEEESLIVLEPERAQVEYEMAVVSVGTVEKTVQIPCIYEQQTQQELSFSLSGRAVEKVYVGEGDHVEKGQLLASLQGGDNASAMEALNYSIARNVLRLEHATINENYDISTRWLRFLYQSGRSAEEEKVLHEDVENISQNYRYQREDLEDAIALDKLQLAQLQEEAKESNLYAGMEGTITWMKENLEGSTSARGERIFVIVDSTQCLFVAEKEEYASYITQDAIMDLSITSGTGAGKYQVRPENWENWAEKQYFVPVDGEGNPLTDVLIEVGARGTLICTLERREDVLQIPQNAVHTGDGKTYVYVMGENQVREIKWITIGLEGDTSVEVIDGLEAGEQVIVK